MTAITYSVPNISCGHCVHTIETELMELPGVKLVNASQETKQVWVEFDDPATAEQIENALHEMNYPVAK